MLILVRRLLPTWLMVGLKGCSQRVHIFWRVVVDSRLKRHKYGFLEVSNPPSSTELSDYYANNYYQNETGSYRRVYSDEELSVIRMRVHQRAAHAFEFMLDVEQGSLLDVGCGEGFVLSHFKNLGWSVKGIDYSRSGVSGMNPDCTGYVTQGDVFQLLDDCISSGERYDIVWLGNVLEHVLDPISLLDNIRKLITSDGILVVTVPNDGNVYHERLLAEEYIDRRFWIAIPDHLSYFTIESLKEISINTGWDVMGVQSDFPVDFYLAHPGSNYVSDPDKGADAHRARIMLESIIGASGVAVANKFYSSLAEVGLGRNITAFLKPLNGVCNE